MAKISELLQDQPIDDPDDFAKNMAKCLTTGTPEDVQSLLDGEVN